MRVGHILSNHCRHSGAIAGFIRYVQSHTLAIAKTIVYEVAHFALDGWNNYKTEVWLNRTVQKCAIKFF